VKLPIVSETATQLGVSAGLVYGLRASKRLRHEHHGLGRGIIQFCIKEPHMWYDPFSAKASEEGCASCGTPSVSCYVVQFSLFPRRLVRKRHRERERTILFCRSCFEATAELPILLNGAEVPVPKKGINDGEQPFQEHGPLCFLCPHRFLPGQGLHGLLQSSLWMSGSCVESLLLAAFCPPCVENLTIELPQKG
jgi:hypothetical protein